METLDTQTPPAVLEVPPTTAERPHHPFGMSKLDNLRKCPGYAAISGSSKFSEEGTALHGIMDRILVQLAAPGAASDVLQAMQKVTAGEDLGDVERGLILWCCRQINHYTSRAKFKILAEQKVEIVCPDNSVLTHGYLDALLIGPVGAARQFGVLIDFKFGGLPVTHASKNLQGLGYALGAFNAHQELEKIEVVFLQPKLDSVTRHVYSRDEAWEMFKTIFKVINTAKEFQARGPSVSHDVLTVGDHCRFCARAGSCVAFARQLNGIAVAGEPQALVPQTFFRGVEFLTPQQLAVAKYWSDLMEGVSERINEAAFAAATNNGGSITAELPNGETVSYSIRKKRMDRKLGGTMEITTAIADLICPEELLTAATFSLGKLEAIGQKAVWEQAGMRGEKITKKVALERFQGTLEALDLLSRPDGEVSFLRRDRAAAVAELADVSAKQ